MTPDGSAPSTVTAEHYEPATIPFLDELRSIAGELSEVEGKRLDDLIARYAPHAADISRRLYEKLPIDERARLVIWFLKRWGGIDRVEADEMKAYQGSVKRITDEEREPVTVAGREYTLQDLNSQGYDFRLATYRWVTSIHDVLYDQYQTESFKVKPGDVVIDAGAFVGDTAALFCAKTQGECQVHAFEVLSENLELLQYNMELNSISDRVVVNRVALSDRSGDVLVIRPAALQGATSVTSVKSGPVDGERIPTVTIDDYVATQGLERVDLIKMDIEGSELPALEGAINTIRKFKPMLALCLYHKWDDVVQIPAFIERTGLDYSFNFKWVQLTHGWEAVLLASPVE